ncbi:conserved hypothetical protein [Geobacillus kaustophilus GBlys]|uniref:Transposase n=1 Tax=Geobacillus kaustophilus GBlys TaxID=1337888 RepID=S4NA20_GEOKU|nr:conserved hypothetical protein [Geobacillus kaustophilus GBlys]
MQHLLGQRDKISVFGTGYDTPQSWSLFLIFAGDMRWKRNGSQLELLNRRCCLHEGMGDVWEGFEGWLMKEYAYDPCRDLLIINGDAAPWIMACREYFGKRACFQLDRFHVARELRQCLSGHPRWREVRKKLAKQDEEGLLVERNSAVGTLGDEGKEQQLAALIRRIESMPGCIRDYREWLSAQGVKTTSMRPMGHAESVMSRFAHRVKSRRSWKDQGLRAFLKAMVARIDGICWRKGRLEEEEPRRAASASTKSKRVEQAKRKAGRLWADVVRQNLPCLQRSSGTPIHQALSALRDGGWV